MANAPIEQILGRLDRTPPGRIMPVPVIAVTETTRVRHVDAPHLDRGEFYYAPPGVSVRRGFARKACTRWMITRRGNWARVSAVRNG